VPKAVRDATNIYPGDYLLLKQASDSESLAMRADPPSTDEGLRQLVQRALAVRAKLRADN